MSLTSALREARRAHEARMVDTFQISVPTGGMVYDPATQSDVEELSPLFTTPGYFATGARSIRAAQAGGRTVLAEPAELRIPWDSQEVPANAVATCTAVGPDTPPRMLGRKVRVNGASGDGSQRTHYPLEVVEVIS